MATTNINITTVDAVVTETIETGNTDAAQSGAVADYIKNNFYPKSTKKILDKIRNPFIRSNIKLIGDSITAGQGGTGYDLNGEVIFDSYRVNDYSAICWANMFRDYVNEYFNGKKLYTGWNNENINMGSSYSFTTLASKSSALILNTDNTGVISFDFYGTELDVEYAKTDRSGILSVYIDGVFHSDIDAYSATSTYLNSFTIDGLTEGTHTFELRNTNTKNASSTGYRFYLYGFSILKYADVKNFGTSGIVSSNIYKERTELIRDGDDIVICQVGVNDRVQDSLNGLNTSLMLLSEYVHSLGMNLVYMVSNPISSSEDTLDIKMVDVANAINHISTLSDIEAVSNYDYFISYCTNTGTTLDSLLGDGLHPNDSGYSVMYKGVMNGLGFPLTISDI